MEYWQFDLSETVSIFVGGEMHGLSLEHKSEEFSVLLQRYSGVQISFYEDDGVMMLACDTSGLVITLTTTRERAEELARRLSFPFQVF